MARAWTASVNSMQIMRRESVSTDDAIRANRAEDMLPARTLRAAADTISTHVSRAVAAGPCRIHRTTSALPTSWM